jgi:hypothetical protein
MNRNEREHRIGGMNHMNRHVTWMLSDRPDLFLINSENIFTAPMNQRGNAHCLENILHAYKGCG